MRLDSPRLQNCACPGGIPLSALPAVSRRSSTLSTLSSFSPMNDVMRKAGPGSRFWRSGFHGGSRKPFGPPVLRSEQQCVPSPGKQTPAHVRSQETACPVWSNEADRPSSSTGEFSCQPASDVLVSIVWTWVVDILYLSCRIGTDGTRRVSQHFELRA
jgi:hypothetical protein